MSQPSKVSTRAPLILAAGVALLVALLVVALVHVLGVRSDHQKATKAGYGLTSDQQAAVNAAATEAANSVTFSRKTFAQDFARALAGATGDFKTDLAGEKALTLSTMTSGKFDLKGTVGSSAYVGPADGKKGTNVLVTINGFKLADAGGSSSAPVQRLLVTVQKVGKAWLANNVQSVGVVQ